MMIIFLFDCLHSALCKQECEWSHYPHADADVHSPERRRTAGEFPAKIKHKASSWRAERLLDGNSQHKKGSKMRS